MNELKVGRIEQLTHTPGPWEIRRARVTVSVRTATGDYVTENVRPLPNQEATTRLIAAAPELLAALRSLVKEIREYHKTFDAHKFVAAERAIAKVEGR